MTIVTASVIANSWNRRPTTSPMNNSGISTAISETVNEMMVKPICSRTLQRGFERVHSVFDVSGNVLDHDDGVVDHEAGSDRQRHQRQIVQAKAEQIHRPQRADERQRHRKAWYDGCRESSAGTERSRSTTRTIASAKLELDVGDRSADGHRPVAQHRDIDSRGKGGQHSAAAAL